ncbi:hypothetical protein IWZ01DRAFT_560931 [Phyllosticta capitalensis]
MEKNADLAKAINAINTRDDKAKFLLYDTIDDPVVQSFYDMLDEEEEASPEDSQTENRLTYISRDHPQVYSYRNMRCDGAQLRDAILNNDTKQFWFSVCLRCLGQRRDLPPDHDWTNCRGICFFCLSYAHVGEPCPGPLRRRIDDVRQVIALEGPGLEWYERMARPQTPPRDLAPVMEAREDKVVQVAEEREVISLLSRSPSSNGKGQGDVGDKSKLAARDEDFVHRPQRLDRDTETFHNDAGYQEHGVLPLPSHGGREWSTEEMVAYYANQRDMAAYVTDSEDEDAYQEDDHGQGETHESEAHPYYPGPHWLDNNDVGQQALGTPSHLPPLSSPFGVEQDVAASVEWDPVVYPGSQEDCAIDLTSDGPGSPQTVIYFDEQRDYAENEYDGGFEAEDYYGETDMEEDEEVGYLVDEDDDGTEMDEDEEYDVKEEDADMNEDDCDTGEVIDLTSSSPPPESNLQQQAIEPQPTLQDAQSTSNTDQDLEGTRSPTPTDACDDLPAAARGNQDGLHASDAPSSDTVMADSPNMAEIPPVQSYLGSHLGVLARDSLSPLRRRTSRPSTTLENIATSDAGRTEQGEQDTFASARDSMTLYSGMSRGQSCTDATALSHSSGDILEQDTTRVSGLQNNQDTSQPRSDSQEPSSSPRQAPPSHTTPDHARDYNQHVESDVDTRENTPLSGTDLIQLQLEVERQRAMRVDSFNAPGYSASLNNEGVGSGGPMRDVDAAQPQLLTGEDDDDERNSDSGSEASASDMSSPGGVPLDEYEPKKFEEQQLSHNKTDEDHGHIYRRGASWPSSNEEGINQASDASANDTAAEEEYDAEEPDMDVEVDNDEDNETEEDERLPGGDFEGQTPPPPSPTPTELAEHQQAIDFAQTYLHHPSSISTISTIADSDEAEEPDMDAEVYNDEGDETEEEDEHLPGGDLLAAPPPPSPSPTPTELAEHQQAIDFAQAHLRPPSPTIADSDGGSDEGATADPSDEDQDPSCPRFLPCGPPAAAGQQAGSPTSWEIDPAQKPVLQHHRAASAPPRRHEAELNGQKQRGGEARARTRSRSPPRGEASVYRLR